MQPLNNSTVIIIFEKIAIFESIKGDYKIIGGHKSVNR